MLLNRKGNGPEIAPVHRFSPDHPVPGHALNGRLIKLKLTEQLPQEQSIFILPVGIDKQGRNDLGVDPVTEIVRMIDAVAG